MNFTMETKEFKKIVKLLSGVSDKRGYIGIRDGFMVACSDGVKMRINYAQILEVEPTRYVKAKVLFTLCDKSKLKTEEVHIALEDDSVVVKSGRSRTKLTTHDNSEVQSVSEPDSPNVVRLRKALLELLISRVDYAAAKDGKDQTRYYLCGVHLTSDNEKLTAVATDGYRMACYSVSADGCSFLFNDPITIGSTALKHIKRFLAHVSQDQDVELLVSKDKGQIVTDYGSITFALLDGSYPDWRRIMMEVKNPVEIDCDKLSKSIDALLTVAGPDKKVIATFGNDFVRLSAGHDGCSGDEDLEYIGEVGDKFYAFNGAYMRDAVDVCECLIEFNNDAPIVGQGLLNKDYKFLVMPMELNRS